MRGKIKRKGAACVKVNTDYFISFFCINWCGPSREKVKKMSFK